MASESSSSIVRGTSIVGSLTMLSRVLGFVRDMLVARLFGSGFYADAFFVAFRIPNLLRSLVAEGALISAFVPVFAQELKEGQASAQRAFSSVIALLLLTTAVLSILGVVFAEAVVLFFAPGFGPGSEKFELCVLLTRIMLPYIMFVSVIALLNGALNSVKIFGASAFAQVVMNIVLIAGAWVAAFMEARAAVLALSFSVIFGGLAQLVAQIPALKRSGFSLRPSAALITPATKRVLRLMLPAVVGAAVYQLTVFLNTVMASLLQEGSVSWLFYADRLTQLPIGIFSIALASVLLPTLSRAHAENNRAQFQENLLNALRYTSFIMIPTAAVLFVLAEPLIRLLFEYGEFDARSTVQTAAAVQAYALGLWAVSCHSMLVRGFIAQHDTVTSTLVGVFSLALTFVLSLLFIGPLSSQAGAMGQFIAASQQLLFGSFTTPALGHAGLALAASLSSLSGCAVLALLLHRRLGRLDWSPFLLATLRSIGASLPILFALTALSTRLSALPLVAIGLPVAAILYLGAAFLLRTPELQETFALISRFIQRRRQRSA